LKLGSKEKGLTEFFRIPLICVTEETELGINGIVIFHIFLIVDRIHVGESRPVPAV